MAKIADRLCLQDLREELIGMSLAVLDPPLYERLSLLRSGVDDQAKQRLEDVHLRLLQTQQLPPDTTLSIESITWERLQVLQRSSIEGGKSHLPQATLGITCPDVTSCYVTMGLLHNLWHRQTGSFQDYMNEPTTNGYRGLHTTVILADGSRVRCKIRTPAMEAYAHRGVTTSCFSGASSESTAALPWTRQISPIARDTAGQSEEFWLGLRRDLLGESMVIHGTEDQVVELPLESTALDAAFYLLGRRAIQTRTIYVDGDPVAFDQHLERGQSVTVDLAATKQVSLRWIESVRTNLSLSHIRAALSAAPLEHRVEVGRQILAEVMFSGRRRVLQELRENVITDAFRSLGYHTLNDGFAAIATGYLSAHHVDAALDRSSTRTWRWRKLSLVRYDLARDDELLAHRATRIFEPFTTRIRRATTLITGGGAFVRHQCTLQITKLEQEQLRTQLQHAGAEHVRITSYFRIALIGTLLVSSIVLWSFEPLLVRWLFTQGVTPASYTVVSLWCLVLFSITTYLATLPRTKIYQYISLREPSLWLSGAFLGLDTALSAYALTLTSASLYISLLRLTQILLLFPALWRMRRTPVQLGILGLTIAGLMLGSANMSFTAFTVCLLTTISFAAYIITSNHYQEKQRVHSRYAQFFLVSYLIAALCSTPLLFLLERTPTLMQVGAIGVTSILFVGLPYLFFYLLTETIAFHRIALSFELIPLITIALEAATIGWQNIPSATLIALCFICATIVGLRATHASAPSST
jgi:hypothetical protein